MKTIVFVLNVISTMFFMGGLLIQHPSAKRMIDELDGGFYSVLQKLKNGQVTPIVQELIKVFGLIAIASIGAIIVFGIFKGKSQILSLLLMVVFLSSIALMGSLYWVFNHKSVMKETGVWLLLLGGGSLLFPVMDMFTGSTITHIFYSKIVNDFGALVNLPASAGLVYEALVVSGLYAGFVILFYLIAWLYAAPVSLMAWLIVAAPIYFSRFVIRAFPVQPIAAVFFIIWFVSLLYLTFG